MKKNLLLAAMLTAAFAMSISAGAAEATTEADEQEVVIRVPETDSLGHWLRAGMAVGDFPIDVYAIDVLPDVIVIDHEAAPYELSEDGTMTVLIDDEELPEGYSDASVVFTPRFLEESDAETYNHTFGDPSDVIGEKYVLEVNTYITSSENPLSDEVIVSSSLYTYFGYASDFIEELLIANPWNVGGKVLTFSYGDSKSDGKLDLNDGETTGTFFVLGDCIHMTWDTGTIRYYIQTISGDAATRGNVTLYEEDRPERTIVLEPIRAEVDE